MWAVEENPALIPLQATNQGWAMWGARLHGLSPRVFIVLVAAVKAFDDNALQALAVR
jgi:hypothetical protein